MVYACIKTFSTDKAVAELIIASLADAVKRVYVNSAAVGEMQVVDPGAVAAAALRIVLFVAELEGMGALGYKICATTPAIVGAADFLFLITVNIEAEEIPSVFRRCIFVEGYAVVNGRRPNYAYFGIVIVA